MRASRLMTADTSVDGTNNVARKSGIYDPTPHW